jgi:AraC-like DNA-binding protein
MALKTTRFSDDQLHFGIGLFAAGSILLLWTRLIPMPDLFPRLNKFSRWYAIANCAAGLLTVIGVFPHLVVDVLARILMMYSNLLFYPTAIIAYRRGFRPALYPIFGMPVFSVFMFCYLMSGVVFSGNLIWKNSVWYAYLVEYSVFFASMVSRIRFETSGQMETFRESLARKSRLTGLDIEQLRLRLEEQLSQGVYEDETLSIAKLALLLKIRPDQLSELINVLYGMGFRRLINSRRVMKAQELLETQLDRTVLAIALDTGFGTKAAFNREFKLQTGLTPTEYRRRNSTLRRP